MDISGSAGSACSAANAVVTGDERKSAVENRCGVRQWHDTKTEAPNSSFIQKFEPTKGERWNGGKGDDHEE
jgi:hypothetical protein